MKKFPDRVELKALLNWAFLEQNNERAWRRFLLAMTAYSTKAQIAAAKFVELVNDETAE